MAIGSTDQHIYAIVAGNKVNKTVRHYGPFDSWPEAHEARSRLTHPELAKIVPLLGIG